MPWDPINWIPFGGILAPRIPGIRDPSLDPSRLPGSQQGDPYAHGRLIASALHGNIFCCFHCFIRPLPLSKNCDKTMATMRMFCLIAGEGREPVMISDEESIQYRSTDVELSFDKSEASRNMGRGALYLTQSRILWIGKQQSFDIDVRFIALHAISRDADSYPVPCLYCQFARDEGAFADGRDAEGDADADVMEDISANALEMFLSPASEDELLPLFEAFSNASLMNPDPVEPGHEDEGEGGDDLIYNLDEVHMGSAQANRVLEHLESLLPDP